MHCIVKRASVHLCIEQCALFLMAVCSVCIYCIVSGGRGGQCAVAGGVGSVPVCICAFTAVCSGRGGQ